MSTLRINRTDEVGTIRFRPRLMYGHLMTRVNHTGHGHPATTAARQACLRFMATHDGMDEVTYRVAQREQEIDDAFDGEHDDIYDDCTWDDLTVLTPVGRVRVGSMVLIEVRGEPVAERYTITEVSDNIKNRRPGVQAINDRRPCWAYADQVTKIIRF